LNTAAYQAARRAGCTAREAEVLATYVESEKMATAAKKIGISEQTAKNAMSHALQRLAAPHAAAAVARLTTS
jgi:DNA-binding CsgD family transcriptional regulator